MQYHPQGAQGRMYADWTADREALLRENEQLRIQVAGEQQLRAMYHRKAEAAEQRAQAAEVRAKELEEAIQLHRDQTYGLALIPTAGIDYNLYAVLSPQAPQLSVEASEVVPPSEVWLVGVDKKGTGLEIKSKIVNVDLQAPQEVSRE